MHGTAVVPDVSSDQRKPFDRHLSITWIRIDRVFGASRLGVGEPRHVRVYMHGTRQSQEAECLSLSRIERNGLCDDHAILLLLFQAGVPGHGYIGRFVFTP